MVHGLDFSILWSASPAGAGLSTSGSTRHVCLLEPCLLLQYKSFVSSKAPEETREDETCRCTIIVLSYCMLSNMYYILGILQCCLGICSPFPAVYMEHTFHGLISSLILILQCNWLYLYILLLTGHFSLSFSWNSLRSPLDFYIPCLPLQQWPQFVKDLFVLVVVRDITLQWNTFLKYQPWPRDMLVKGAFTTMSCCMNSQ